MTEEEYKVLCFKAAMCDSPVEVKINFKDKEEIRGIKEWFSVDTKNSPCSITSIVRQEKYPIPCIRPLGHDGPHMSGIASIGDIATLYFWVGGTRHGKQDSK